MAMWVIQEYSIHTYPSWSSEFYMYCPCVLQHWHGVLMYPVHVYPQVRCYPITQHGLFLILRSANLCHQTMFLNTTSERKNPFARTLLLENQYETTLFKYPRKSHQSQHISQFNSRRSQTNQLWQVAYNWLIAANINLCCLHSHGLLHAMGGTRSGLLLWLLLVYHPSLRFENDMLRSITFL